MTISPIFSLHFVTPRSEGALQLLYTRVLKYGSTHISLLPLSLPVYTSPARSLARSSPLSPSCNLL